MATVDTTIPAQLRALVRLQHYDSQLDNLRKLRGGLPDEIRDLEDEKTGLETRLRNFQQEEADGVKTLSNAESQIRESETLIKRYTEQQNTVRNNREYDALTKDIEAQRQRIIDAQARIDEVTGSKQPRAEATEAAHARMAEIAELLETKRGELAGVMEDTRAESEAIQTQREEAAEAVDPRYLHAYERLRARLRDGRAVVPLERGAAGGFAVPPQRQVEIRQRTRIIPCEHTGRIIVDAELFQEVQQEVSAAA
jgi:uncharacterized protein